MKLWQRDAPAHRSLVCAGAFVLCAAIAACDRGVSVGDTGDRTLELSGDTIDLASGITLHDVQLRAVTGGDFKPDRITARVGDVLRFTSDDNRTHSVRLTAPSVQGEAVLAATEQSRSPPLVTRGQAWVVSLEKVPAGSYTITCVSHAGAATLIVQ